MTYKEALQYLDTIYNTGTKLGLDTMRRLMERLGNPQKQMKIIHVAGTNGKGSTTAMLSSILREAGFSVGMYTSPHLVRYNERISVDGADISDDDFAKVIGRVAEASAQMMTGGSQPPKVFETLTAAGFLYFANKKVDYLILEVGLGGRYDATNIVENPELAVICAIGMDHMDFLGNSLDAIAREKSGIIKENCPVVLYTQGKVVYNVVKEICREKGSNLYFAPENKISIQKKELGATVFTIENAYLHYDAVLLPLNGVYQIENCATVLLCCYALNQKGLGLTSAQIRRGIANTIWHGRMEVCGQKPLLFIDGAHNADGILMLAKSLQTYFPQGDITLVLGVLGDKEYETMAAEIVPLAKQIVLTEPNSKRKLDADTLKQVLGTCGKPLVIEKSIAKAVKLAKTMAGEDGVVCCAGSLYLIGEIRRLLEEGEL